MSRRILYGIAFIAVTLSAVGMEFWYAFDGSDDTLPWTDYLIRLPWLVLVPLSVGFGGWLVWHLADAKRRKERNRT